MILIDGPRIAPKSGQAKKLVILFHGYGSNGADLAGLAQHWAPHFPDVAWASPDAPESVPGAPGGYQWFPISNLDPQRIETGASAAWPIVEQEDFGIKLIDTCWRLETGAWMREQGISTTMACVTVP